MLRTGTRVRAPALSTRSIALSAIRTFEGWRTWRIGASGLIGHWDLVIGNSRVALFPFRSHAPEHRQRRPSFLVTGSSLLIPLSSFLVPRLRFPRASAGFMILAASMLPSALPAARVRNLLPYRWRYVVHDNEPRVMVGVRFASQDGYARPGSGKRRPALDNGNW
jgi:hypothetical protein